MDTKKFIQNKIDERLTYREIGKLLNISRQRVHQIIKGYYSPYYLKTRNIGGYSRELARKRDKYACQDCGKKWKIGERRLDVHHLNGLCGTPSRGYTYDKVSNIDGLITLCHKCHFNRPDHRLKLRILDKN